jgi:hypothetical protein
MRWRLAFGFGLAGLAAGSALGQFAADRVPASPQGSPSAASPQAAPQSPPGLQTPPATPIGYNPPTGGILPAGGVSTDPAATQKLPSLADLAAQQPTRQLTPAPRIDIESALGPDHPWALRPEHGAYFICVKSYSRPHVPTPDDNGPSARVLAEKLATEIREKWRVQAFLYEYISEERKAEAAALAAEREKGRQFLQQMEERKQQSQLNGAVWLPPDNKIRFKTVNYRDQIAVLVGGFKTDLDAREALDKVHTWPAPSDKSLMDGVVAANLTNDQKAALQNGFINPYKSATVVPNPLIPRPTQPAASRLDPFIVKLNGDNPYNLLKATKDWTLAVKAFSGPVQIVGRETDTSEKDKPLIQKLSFSNKGANALLAAAAQAEALAKMLREMKGPGGQSLGLEAFVLHTRNNSIVTIGQFDGPSDPALVQMQNLLVSMKLSVSEDKMGSKPVANTPKILDEKMIPMPIPKP